MKAGEACKARAQPAKKNYVDGTMFSARAFTLGGFFKQKQPSSVNLHSTQSVRHSLCYVSGRGHPRFQQFSTYGFGSTQIL